MPGDWFYDGKAIRSDSFGFIITTTSGSTGSNYTSQPLSPPRMTWKTDRLILGVVASVELTVGPASADDVLTASAFLAKGEASSINLVGPTSLTTDGGIPNIYCGTFCSLNLTNGSSGTKSKNFGVGFGRTPPFIAAGDPVRWYVIYTIPNPPTAGSLVGNATFYTIPAR